MSPVYPRPYELQMFGLKPFPVLVFEMESRQDPSFSIGVPGATHPTNGGKITLNTHAVHGYNDAILDCFYGQKVIETVPYSASGLRLKLIGVTIIEITPDLASIVIHHQHIDIQ